jgi:signal transduction histidine kinase
VVRDSVETAQLGGHRVSVSVPDGPVRVDADARRIGQVLANLLANAAAYSPEGSVIDVMLEADPGRKSAVVSVRDHGPGIPAAQRRRLFRKFSRLSSADGTRGSGLGLYISKAIAEDHGGELRYAAARPGSVFSLVLPLRARARKKA